MYKELKLNGSAHLAYKNGILGLDNEKRLTDSEVDKYKKDLEKEGFVDNLKKSPSHIRTV